MSEIELRRADEKPATSAAAQVLQWARCHPGMVLLGSLAVAALLTAPSPPKPPKRPRQPETEADFVDGETPFFV